VTLQKPLRLMLQRCRRQRLVAGPFTLRFYIVKIHAQPPMSSHVSTMTANPTLAV
jgi:hypothetical protein